MKKKISRELIENGFTVIATGGNCTAWSRTINNYCVMISDDASANLDGLDCCVSILDQDWSDLHHEQIPVEQAVSRAIYLANQSH